MRTAVQKLAGYLKENNLTLALAESVTCGFAAHDLGNVSGTADFFRGCIVCYDESVKKELFGISAAKLKKYTAESQEVTDALAKKLKQLMSADVYAAVTGLAASGGSETPQKPVGTVFYSILYKKRLYTLRKKFNGAPKEIKEKACRELFHFILSVVKA